MTENAADFKTRLIRGTGLSELAIRAAWPDWWTDGAEASPSARAELRFSLARKLGLDPRTLLDDDEPRFIWDESAKFKGFRGDGARERPALTSFGRAVAQMLIEGVPVPAHDFRGTPAPALRESILTTRPMVGLIELSMVAWGLGIPVIHLRVYPLIAKRMSAMSVRIGDRYAILLAHDARYPAAISFHLAHELGHIALGHIGDGESIVDISLLDDRQASESPDVEETEADAYALELLTGIPNPQITISGNGKNARELAQQSIRIGLERRIEPGTLALCYGHATGNWSTSTKALEYIYEGPFDVWRAINKIADEQFHWNSLSDESASFLQAVMGGRANV